MVRATAIISGRVQGVFFRAHAKNEALKLGLTGYAQNRDDGTVAIILEGPAPAVKDFLAWAQKGPAFAKVNSLAVDWGEAHGGFTDFEVR